MRVQKVKKVVGATIMSFALVAGMTGGAVGAQTGTGTIVDTGPDSTNVIVAKKSMRVRVMNHNDLTASNVNDQLTATGEAEVEDNTTGGDAKTGKATNTNTLIAKATVTNTSPSKLTVSTDDGDLTGIIKRTGPDSTNKIVAKERVSVSVMNHNDMEVTTTNIQTATTGDAEVEDNTSAGDATTGDASNTSTSTIIFTVSN
jgi:hypothetical protein